MDDWNALPQEIRNLDSITSFKTYLDRDKPIPNKLYFIVGIILLSEITFLKIQQLAWMSCCMGMIDLLFMRMLEYS